MRKVIAILLASVWAAIALTQTPTYLHIPAPRGDRVTVAEWAVAEAKLLGYEGVVVPVGTDQIQDPATTDWSGFRDVVNQALACGLRVHVRLGQNVPVMAYRNGVAIGPSAWVTRYNNGVAWRQPYRPPLSVCPYISKLVWQRATEILYDACLANSLNPSVYASEELSNEPGIGGAGGAYYGTSLSNAIWPGGAEGSIEPYYWTMMRSLRYSYSARSIPTYAVTLEGTAGAVGDVELSCVTGPDALRLSQGCTGWGFNRYASLAASPGLSASVWASRFSAQVKRMRANPLIGSKRLFNTEFGLKNSSVLISGLSEDVSIADYRCAVLRSQRSMSGVVGSGWFLAISTNSLGSGYHLFNADRSVVGGFVGPAAIRD